MSSEKTVYMAAPDLPRVTATPTNERLYTAYLARSGGFAAFRCMKSQAVSYIAGNHRILPRYDTVMFTRLWPSS